MKKIYFSLVALLFAATNFVSGQSASCDTLRNYNLADDLFEIGGPSGYLLGHDILDGGGTPLPVRTWAEPYSLGAVTSQVRQIRFIPFKAHSVGGSVTFNVYANAAGLPGAVLQSETVAISDFTPNQFYTLDFVTPATISGDFWVGYDLTYTFPQDTFAILGTFKPGGTNFTSFYLSDAPFTDWYDVDAVYTIGGAPLISAWALDVMVSDGPNPIAEITSLNDDAVCFGTNFLANGSGSINTDYWEWYLFDNPATVVIDDATGTSVTLEPTGPGDYIVALFAHGSCRENIAAQAVYVDPPVSATVSTTNATCGLNNGSITFTNPQGGFGPYTYSIDGTNFVAASSFINLAPNNYTVYVQTSGTGCQASYNVTVGNTPAEQITPGANQTICAGAQATLTASGNGNIEWFLGATSIGIGNSIQVSPAATTNYTAILTDVNFCEDPATIVVTVNALPTLTASATNSTICSGAQTTISVTGNASNYTWDQGLGAGTTFNVQPTTTTLYTVTGVDGNTCSNTSQISITVNPLDNAGFTFPNFCEGATNGAQNIQTPGGVFSFNPAATDGASINGTTGQITDGILGTTYTVQYTTNATCPNSSTVNVTVQSQDDAGFSFDNFCVGTQTLPNNIQTSGGAFSFVVVPADGATINTTTGEILNGVAGASYEVQYTTPSGLCQSSSSLTVSVFAIPTITATADQSICAGNNITITASGGATYSWDQGLGNGASHSVSPSVNTTYTVVGVSANGCSNTASVTLTVLPSPSVSAGADQTVCEGLAVTLTANNPDAATIDWSGGINDGVAFTPSATATYTVTATATNGCEATSNVLVTVTSAPVVSAGGNLDFCIYNSATPLAGTPAGGTFNGTGVTGNTFDPAAAGLGSHVITYTFEDVTGCEGTDDITITVDACLSLNQVDFENHIMVYPNPASTTVIITTSNGALRMIEMMNAEGRIVRSVSNDNSSVTMIVSVEGLQTGVYLLRISGEENQYIRKVIVK